VGTLWLLLCLQPLIKDGCVKGSKD
jgi:hypothetical protein